MWERRHGSVGHLSRLPDCWSGDHDWDRAVDRSLLFANRQPADIAVLVLRDVLVGLARRGPHHRAEGGDNGSAVSRLASASLRAALKPAGCRTAGEARALLRLLHAVLEQGV